MDSDQLNVAQNQPSIEEEFIILDEIRTPDSINTPLGTSKELAETPKFTINDPMTGTESPDQYAKPILPVCSECLRLQTLLAQLESERSCEPPVNHAPDKFPSGGDESSSTTSLKPQQTVGTAEISRQYTKLTLTAAALMVTLLAGYLAFYMKSDLRNNTRVLYEKDLRITNLINEVLSVEQRLNRLTNSSYTKEQVVQLLSLTWDEATNKLRLSPNLRCEVPRFEVKFFEQTYTGIYRGTCLGSTPNGYGEFYLLNKTKPLLEGDFRGGQMHGSITAYFGSRTVQYQFVHGTAEGSYRTASRELHSEFGCMLGGKPVGPHMRVDANQALVYTVLGKYHTYLANTVKVHANRQVIEMIDHDPDNQEKLTYALSNLPTQRREVSSCESVCWSSKLRSDHKALNMQQRRRMPFFTQEAEPFVECWF